MLASRVCVKLMYRVHRVFTRYRTARLAWRARNASLYHSRQCSIVIKPRLDGLDHRCKKTFFMFFL